MRECKWMGRRSRQWSAPNQEYKQRNTHNIWVDVERGQERMGRWNQIQFHLKHVNVLLSQRASRWHAITFPDMRVACMCVAVDIRYMHVKVPQTFRSCVKRCIAKKKNNNKKYRLWVSRERVVSDTPISGARFYMRVHVMYCSVANAIASFVSSTRRVPTNKTILWKTSLTNWQISYPCALFPISTRHTVGNKIATLRCQ